MADEEFDFDALEARIQAAKQAKSGAAPAPKAEPKPTVKARTVTAQDKPRSVEAKAATVTKSSGDPVAQQAMKILSERGGDIGEEDKPAPRPAVPMRTNSEWLASRKVDESFPPNDVREREEAERARRRGEDDLSIVGAAPMPVRSAPPKPTVIDMSGDTVTENGKPLERKPATLTAAEKRAKLDAVLDMTGIDTDAQVDALWSNPKVQQMLTP